jgi:Flp pilus assembly pilin Flp
MPAGAENKILHQVNMMPPTQNARQQGQSLAEYGLIISLIAVVSIGGLMILGQSLGNVLSGMRNTVMGQHSSTSSLANSLTGSGGSLGATSLQQSPTARSVSGPGSACYADGQCLNLDAVNAVSTNTAGANGSEFVKSYADIFEQIAQQAANDPNADPTLRELATKLANSGHTLASHEATILQQVTDNYGVQNATRDGFNAERNNFGDLKAEFASYLQYNPGALPPEISAIAMDAASQIETHTENYLLTDSTSILNESGVMQNVQRDTKPTDAAQPVRNNANTICRNGGNTTGCIR